MTLCPFHENLLKSFFFYCLHSHWIWGDAECNFSDSIEDIGIDAKQMENIKNDAFREIPGGVLMTSDVYFIIIIFCSFYIFCVQI